MQTKAVSGPDELRETFEEDEDIDYELDERTAESLWALWSEFMDANPEVDRLLYIQGWFAMKELDMRRPFLFARTEYDNSDKGAVLFGDMYIVDISVVENGAHDVFDHDESMVELDISEDDDYIDESGKMWIPRKLVQSFVRYA